MVHIINKNYSVVRVLCIVEKYQIYLVNLGSVHQKKPCSAKITSKFLFKIGKFTALLKALWHCDTQYFVIYNIFT